MVARSVPATRRPVALPNALQRFGQRLLSHGAIDVHGVARQVAHPVGAPPPSSGGVCLLTSTDS
jgi:hypothetical protein